MLYTTVVLLYSSNKLINGHDLVFYWCQRSRNKLGAFAHYFHFHFHYYYFLISSFSLKIQYNKTTLHNQRIVQEEVTMKMPPWHERYAKSRTQIALLSLKSDLIWLILLLFDYIIYSSLPLCNSDGIDWYVII